jgi:hypothetical protein
VRGGEFWRRLQRGEKNQRKNRELLRERERLGKKVEGTEK